MADRISGLTSHDMRERLRRYYGVGEWALFFEVLDATGARHTRSADAVAMNTWPSRGLAMHGHEIKVSRSDWLSELKRPGKAEAIAKFCDYWWLVAPREIVQPGELPETWGLICPFGDTLKIERQAVKMEAQPITRQFAASLLRNAARLDAEAMRAAMDAEIKVERKKMQERIDSAVKDRSYHYQQMKDAVDKFESASGVKIEEWNGGDIGRAVRAVLALGGKYGGLSSLANQLHGMSVKLKKEIEGLGIDTPEETLL